MTMGAFKSLEVSGKPLESTHLKKSQTSFHIHESVNDNIKNASIISRQKHFIVKNICWRNLIKFIKMHYIFLTGYIHLLDRKNQIFAFF